MVILVQYWIIGIEGLLTVLLVMTHHLGLLSTIHSGSQIWMKLVQVYLSFLHINSSTGETPVIELGVDLSGKEILLTL